MSLNLHADGNLDHKSIRRTLAGFYNSVDIHLYENCTRWCLKIKYSKIQSDFDWKIQCLVKKSKYGIKTSQQSSTQLNSSVGCYFFVLTANYINSLEYVRPR